MSVLSYRGKLEGHTNWVTALATSAETPNTLLTASRDKKLIQWELTTEYAQADEENNRACGIAKKCLSGHNQAVSDVVISSDGQFALSGSWDKTMRLWDLSKGTSVRTFKGHTSDVLSVAFSADNRQIVSAGRDKTIKLWNTLAECKFTIPASESHSDWVSCVRFSPSAKQPLIVSCGWDKLIKVWNLSDCKLKFNLAGHAGVLNNITISPDGSLCASGGKDGTAMLWDINDGKHLYSLEAGSSINALCFSPKHYWLCAATDNSVRVWDLETKQVLVDIVPEESQTPKGGLPWVTCLTWSADGNTLYVGSTDSNIYVYEVSNIN